MTRERMEQLSFERAMCTCSCTCGEKRGMIVDWCLSAVSSYENGGIRRPPSPLRACELQQRPPLTDGAPPPIPHRASRPHPTAPTRPRCSSAPRSRARSCRRPRLHHRLRPRWPSFLVLRSRPHRRHRQACSPASACTSHMTQAVRQETGQPTTLQWLRRPRKTLRSAGATIHHRAGSSAACLHRGHFRPPCQPSPPPMSAKTCCSILSSKRPPTCTR